MVFFSPPRRGKGRSIVELYFLLSLQGLPRDEPSRIVYCGGLRPVPPIRGAVDDDDDDCLDDGHDGHERMLGGSPPGPPGG